MKIFSIKSILIIFTFVNLIFSINAQDSSCDYFGLSEPKDTPEKFNPETLNLDGRFKFNVEITNCNEVYFTTIDANENIYVSKKENDTWSHPKIASFSDPNYNDADPFLSKDGKTMYFISTRPTNVSDNNQDYNIWSSNNLNGKWSQPKPLPETINTDDFDEYFFSISNKGNVFFSSNRTGGEGSFDIYTAKILDDYSFTKPKNVGKPISTEKYEFDPYISPDERFIIFSINENNNSSLYYSYKDKNNEWVKPQNMGEKINITNQDFAPSLSPDGKFIFFSNNGKLKWISTDILSIP
ncbi:TolB family protein [Winogradskyella flava]|uniref:TolB family protein n=1 Tax=Winogradskyella flava TaxID=1884876 RepID=UPI002490988E|nr:hypothetical protein [Winogradskyella flava]